MIFPIKNKAIRMLASIITYVVFIYLGLVILLFIFQAKLIFPADKDVLYTPKDYDWQYEDLKIDVDGQTTHAWYVPVEYSKGTILFSHGNAGNLCHRLDIIGLWRSLGLDVLAYDYGGYGNSTGSASEKRCYEDVRAMWKYLTEERGISPDKIIIYGRSLGGGVATQLATEVDAAGLILESTFSSVTQMAKDTYPFVPVSLMLRHRFDTAGKIAQINMPVQVLHSPYDNIIPYKHGKKVLDLAKEPKYFAELTGAHNDGVAQFTQESLNTIEIFLETTISDK